MHCDSHMQSKILCHVHDRLHTNLLLASAAAAASLVKTWMWRSRPAGIGFLSCMDADAASLTKLLSSADCAFLTAVCVWLFLLAEEVPRPFEIMLLSRSCAALAGEGEVSDCAGWDVLLGAYITAGDASCCAASLLAGGTAVKGGGGSAARIMREGAGTLGAGLSVSPSLCSVRSAKHGAQSMASHRQICYSDLYVEAGSVCRCTSNRDKLHRLCTIPVTSSSFASFGKLAKRTGVVGSRSFFW